MHENNKTQVQERQMESDSSRNGPAAWQRQTQCPDAQRPLVTCSPLHGSKLGNPPESSASQRQCPSGGKTDMDGIRQERKRDPEQQEQSHQGERLETMGQIPDDGRKSLHSQKSEAMVVADSAPHGTVSTENVLRLLEHQQYRCALTGRKLTPQTAALDHIIPVRFGGKHVIENAQVLHKDANRAKGSLTSEEFIALCKEVVRRTKSLKRKVAK